MTPRTAVERLADMRAAIADIQHLTSGGRNRFKADRLVQQAVAYNLAVLGEAARSLAPELRRRYPDLPWLDMIDHDQQLAAIEDVERERASEA